MHSALDYLALAIATLPASALFAAVICAAWDEHRFWNSDNEPRPEAWHRQGRTASTQVRTRR
jgi:hypothetical protein